MNDAVNEPLPIDASDWSDDVANNYGASRKTAAVTGAPDALMDFARSRLIAMVEEARGSLVAQVRGLKSISDLIGDNLGGNIAPVAKLAGEASGTIDAIADALAEKSVEELIEDGRDLVRAQPAAAIGLAIAIGFLAGRMLKAARD